MANPSPRGVCPICGGELVDGTTDFSVTIDSEVFTVPDVIGSICTRCGEVVIPDSTVESVMNEAKNRRSQIAAQRLAAMGGTAPDIQPIRRRRLIGNSDG